MKISKKITSSEFALDLRQGETRRALTSSGDLYERAIGVIYRPQTEMQSHYFRANLTRQFDIAVFYSESHAIVPVEEWGGKRDRDEPELIPTGL